MKKSYHSTVVPMQDAIAIRRIIAGVVVVCCPSILSSLGAVSGLFHSDCWLSIALELQPVTVIASPAGAWRSSGTGLWIAASLRSSR